ncbi:hypothetical protein NDU88_007649 [Pleurodeles waltl]|uniref:Uncharacterized protein n=1 Tax=Pleurodeles waltl TaxID=8319 RepID=A0AAV7U238_PLEWA|nr:hypothetical protein NDU88_007649 [Pleurodeles waltl]
MRGSRALPRARHSLHFARAPPRSLVMSSFPAASAELSPGTPEALIIRILRRQTSLARIEASLPCASQLSEGAGRPGSRIPTEDAFRGGTKCQVDPSSALKRARPTSNLALRGRERGLVLQMRPGGTPEKEPVNASPSETASIRDSDASSSPHPPRGREGAYGRDWLAGEFALTR